MVPNWVFILCNICRTRLQDLNKKNCYILTLWLVKCKSICWNKVYGIEYVKLRF